MLRSILVPLCVSAGLLVVSSASAYVLGEDSSSASIAPVENASTPAAQVETTATQIAEPVRHGSRFHCEDAVDLTLLANDRIEIRTGHATSTGELIEGDALLHGSSLKLVRLDARMREHSAGSIQLTFSEKGEVTATTYACRLND